MANRWKFNDCIVTLNVGNKNLKFDQLKVVINNLYDIYVIVYKKLIIINLIKIYQQYLNFDSEYDILYKLHLILGVNYEILTFESLNKIRLYTL